MGRVTPCCSGGVPLSSMPFFSANCLSLEPGGLYSRRNEGALIVIHLQYGSPFPGIRTMSAPRILSSFGLFAVLLAAGTSFGIFFFHDKLSGDKRRDPDADPPPPEKYEELTLPESQRGTLWEIEHHGNV